MEDDADNAKLLPPQVNYASKLAVMGACSYESKSKLVFLAGNIAVSNRNPAGYLISVDLYRNVTSTVYADMLSDYPPFISLFVSTYIYAMSAGAVTVFDL